MTESVTKTLQSADILRLMSITPHRYPFLLIDRLIEIDGDESAVGIKNVTFNEPHFTGHFPEMPIMPGVLIIECMAQTAAAVALLAQSVETKSLIYFMSIEDAKFRKPVVPGDQLHIHVKKIKRRGSLMKYACEARVDGNKVAEAVVTAMLVKKNGEAESGTGQS